MGRHKAREEALKILYPLEVGRKDIQEILNQANEIYGKDPQWPFVQNLVNTVNTHLPNIDAVIAPHSPQWALSRMARIDLTVLRMGVAEMLYFPEIPYEVSINEAIELGKKYGDVDSGIFINGVLANIHRHLLTAVPES